MTSDCGHSSSVSIIRVISLLWKDSLVTLVLRGTLHNLRAGLIFHCPPVLCGQAETAVRCQISAATKGRHRFSEHLMFNRQHFYFSSALFFTCVCLCCLIKILLASRFCPLSFCQNVSFCMRYCHLACVSSSAVV